MLHMFGQSKINCTYRVYNRSKCTTRQLNQWSKINFLPMIFLERTHSMWQWHFTQSVFNDIQYVHWSDRVCLAGKGRSFLVLYAIVLVMAHPVANFNKNVMIMSNSATCGQELSYNQTKEVLNQIANPLAGNHASLPSHWRQFTVDLLLTAKNKFSRRVTDLQFIFGNP